MRVAARPSRRRGARRARRRRPRAAAALRAVESSSAPAATSSASRRRCSRPWRTNAASRATSRRPRPEGLRDQPTPMNNVETLAFVPAIIAPGRGRHGRRSGTRGCTGLKFVALSAATWSGPASTRCRWGPRRRAGRRSPAASAAASHRAPSRPAGRRRTSSAPTPWTRRSTSRRSPIAARCSDPAPCSSSPRAPTWWTWRERRRLLPQRVLRQVRPVPRRLGEGRARCWSSPSPARARSATSSSCPSSTRRSRRPRFRARPGRARAVPLRPPAFEGEVRARFPAD